MKRLQLTYGYDDVTLVPAYSDLKSRSEADPKMHDYKLPIIASCMDTLGPEVMEVALNQNIPFIVHRAFKSAEEQFSTFIKDDWTYEKYDQVNKCVWFAVGSVQKYNDWIDYLFKKGVRRFCVDMAHGDSKTCIDTIKYIRDLDYNDRRYNIKPLDYVGAIGGREPFKAHIIAGNVATAEGFKRLQEAGADGIRIGVASGQICFLPKTLVTFVSSSGKVYQQEIKYIKVGDYVITSTGHKRKVLKTYKNSYSGEIYVINKDVCATPTHKFYVYDTETQQKLYKEIKDVDEKKDRFITMTPMGEKYEKASIDIDEYSGDVYNIEVDEDHSYCVGKQWFCVSNCSTALQTGFGVPILTNIIECKKVQKNGTWIIADGGVKVTGDIAKAVYFGADFCMIGKLFASTDKACGRCYNKNKEQILDTQLRFEHDEPCFLRPIYRHEFEELYQVASKLDWEKHDAEGRRKKAVINNLVVYKEYHGMASRDARQGVLSYASVEGVAGLVKYSGTTEQFINDTKLRLQASLSYAGARNWNEFRKNAYPVMRSNAGIIAADTHLDVTLDS